MFASKRSNEENASNRRTNGSGNGNYSPKESNQRSKPRNQEKTQYDAPRSHDGGVEYKAPKPRTKETKASNYNAPRKSGVVKTSKMSSSAPRVKNTGGGKSNASRSNNAGGGSSNSKRR